MEYVEDEITNAALDLNAMTEADVKIAFQRRLVTKSGRNSHTSLDLVPISRITFRKYRKALKVSVRKGKVKPKSRVEPYLNFRNAISKAAGLTALSKIAPIENFHSADEVGVFLFGWHKRSPRLCSTRATDEFLRKNYISRSITEEQRVVHIGATVQAEVGGLTSYYLRITDSNFPKVFKSDGLTLKPEILIVDKATRFYVVLCHPDVENRRLYTPTYYISCNF